MKTTITDEKVSKKDMQKRARQQLQCIPAVNTVARGVYSFGTSGYGIKVSRHLMPVNCELACRQEEWCGITDWKEL